MFQFALTQISNGFLVQHPDFSASGRVMAPNQMQQPPAPICKFCSDFDGVVTYLKSIWPIHIEG